MVTKKLLSRDEWIVIIDYYFFSEEAEHDDSNPKLHKLASRLGRTAAALNLCLRNIKYIDTCGEAGMPNASALASEVFEEYRGRPQRLHIDGQQILREQF